MKAPTRFNLGPSPWLPLEVIERGKREREFFDHSTHPQEIVDESLLVPSRLGRTDLPPEIRNLKPYLVGKRVCEFGCGHGVISAYFALQGAEVFGFDISESNIKVARRTACVNGVESRMHVQVMQGERTAYPDNFFDFVFGNAILHHLDLTFAAREVFRVLKPGGVAVFLDPLGENRLLEWARNCPLRSATHRHSQDERSLLYVDLAVLRTVFSQMSYREMALLTIVRAVFRGAGTGRIGISWEELLLKHLYRVDDWLLEHLPLLRPFASYLLICLPKPNDADSSGSSTLGSILQSCNRALRR